MPRVVVLNNYPLEDVWEEVKRGEKPDHHLFGINYFHERDFEVDIIPFRISSFLQRVNQLIYKAANLLPLGNLDQQWAVLQVLNQADIIYAPCQTQIYFLSYLRALGLLQVPIVCLAHHPLHRGRLAWLRSYSINLMVKGVDAFPSLSRQVAQEINAVSSPAVKSFPLQWGPEASYYPEVPSIGQGVVAAGRTGRDFVTFGLAASQAQIDAHIVCLQSSVDPLFSSFSDRVQVTVRPDQAHMKYPELLRLYQAARVIAIPMVAGSSLCGLTSLMDALGMGKPVIMTHNPLIDLDIEKEGIGKWVKPGDIEGWKQALLFFEENEREALAMGGRARDLVESGINSEKFANQIMDIFSKLIAA